MRSFSGNGRGPDGNLPPHDPDVCAECAAELDELDGLEGVHGPSRPEAGWRPPDFGADSDLGDIVVVLLASTLAGLRDRLHRDGFDGAARLVDDLVEVADDYVLRLSP